MPKDFLSVADFSADELWSMADRAASLRTAHREGRHERTLGVLRQLPFLRKLYLHGNAVEAEASYRAATIFAIPSLEQLDSTLITPRERADAAHLFTAKRIEKKYACDVA